MLEENLYGLRDVQESLLHILDDFNNICKSKNIQYSVFSGPLLGAVREKGFIPWDDDVDVIMDIANYQLLLQSLDDNKVYHIDAWVPRFRNRDVCNGPFIDIFLFTSAPQGVKRKTKILRLKTLQGMLKKYNTVKHVSFLYRILIIFTKILGSLFPRRYLLNQYWKTGYGKNYESEFYYAPNVGFSGLNFMFNRDKINKGYTELVFESIKVQSYAEYDYILQILYGCNYMTPINETERIAYHSNQINNN